MIVYTQLSSAASPGSRAFDSTVCVMCIYIYIAPRVASYRAKRKKIIIYITHTTHITDVTDISDITHVTSLDPS